MNATKRKKKRKKSGKNRQLTGTSLDHVADEMRVVLARDDLIARVVDQREDVRGQQTELVVSLGASLFSRITHDGGSRVEYVVSF